MLILKSQFGSFILTNALRIDFYSALESSLNGSSLWQCHMSIDQYSHILTCFEDEMDAATFCSFMTGYIVQAISQSQLHPYSPLELKDVMTDAMDSVMERETE